MSRFLLQKLKYFDARLLFTIEKDVCEVKLKFQGAFS